MHPMLLVAFNRDATPEQKLEAYRDSKGMFVRALIIYAIVAVACGIWYAVDTWLV